MRTEQAGQNLGCRRSSVSLRPGRGRRSPAEELLDLGNHLFPQAGHRSIKRPFIGNLGHIIVGPERQGLQRFGSATLGKRTEHDYPHPGIIAANMPQHFQTNRAVGGRSRHLDRRIGLKRHGDQSTDNYRVIYHQYANPLTGLEWTLVHLIHIYSAARTGIPISSSFSLRMSFVNGFMMYSLAPAAKAEDI